MKVRTIVNVARWIALVMSLVGYVPVSLEARLKNTHYSIYKRLFRTDVFEPSEEVLDLVNDQESDDTSSDLLSSLAETLVDALAVKANKFIERARAKLLEEQKNQTIDVDQEAFNSLTRLISIQAADTFHETLGGIKSEEFKKLRETLEGMHEIKLLKKLGSGQTDHQVIENVYSFFQAIRALMPEIQERPSNVPGGALASFLECLAEGVLPVLAEKTGNIHALRWVNKLVASSCYPMIQEGAVAILPILSAFSGPKVVEDAVDLLREFGNGLEDHV